MVVFVRFIVFRICVSLEMFDDSFIDSLPNEPLLALSDVVDIMITKWGQLPAEQEAVEYEFFLEGFAIASALAKNIPAIDFELPSISAAPDETVSQIHDFCTRTKTEIAKHIVQLKSAQFSRKYDAKLGAVFSYEFSDGDLERIQHLINELRDLISDSADFGGDHKRRLLGRLEKVQAEMHKKMSDLDLLWGLVGEAGVALGKFGEEAKPFVDRIREITNIVWRTQSRAEELPSDTPFELPTAAPDAGDE